jgi:activator of 2-hydroxyglutaryl-CoA dehydratase
VQAKLESEWSVGITRYAEVIALCSDYDVVELQTKTCSAAAVYLLIALCISFSDDDVVQVQMKTCSAAVVYLLIV